MPNYNYTAVFNEFFDKKFVLSRFTWLLNQYLDNYIILFWLFKLVKQLINLIIYTIFFLALSFLKRC